MRSISGWMIRTAVQTGVAVVLTLGLWGPGPASAQDDAQPDKRKVDPPKKAGLLVNDSRAQQGYTLLAPIMSTKTYLLDMQGRVVRTWERESGSALSTYLLENGHVLRLAKLPQQTFGDGPGGA